MILLPANFHWRGSPVDVVVAVGDRPKTKAMDWMMKFNSGKKRLLVFQMNEEWYAFGPPAFQADIRDRVGRGEKPWAE